VVIIITDPTPPPVPVQVTTVVVEDEEVLEATLTDYHQEPGSAGFDFSEERILSFDHELTDAYFESRQGEYFMHVRSDADIQDLGPTNALLKIENEPMNGWAATHSVRLQRGRAYLLWTWDDRYIEFRVTSMSPNRLIFDWAYMLNRSHPQLSDGVRDGNGRQLFVRTKFDR
jgi:hypothetical protein